MTFTCRRNHKIPAIPEQEFQYPLERRFQRAAVRHGQILLQADQRREHAERRRAQA
jgi:hypothetical protein